MQNILDHLPFLCYNFHYNLRRIILCLTIYLSNNNKNYWTAGSKKQLFLWNKNPQEN